MAAPTLVAPVRAAPAKASGKRDPWFDNAKMLLVTLVVVGPVSYTHLTLPTN